MHACDTGTPEGEAGGPDVKVVLSYIVTLRKTWTAGDGLKMSTQSQKR